MLIWNYRGLDHPAAILFHCGLVHARRPDVISYVKLCLMLITSKKFECGCVMSVPFMWIVLVAVATFSSYESFLLYVI